VHVSEACAALLQEADLHDEFDLEYRGEVHLKGKGSMKTYFVNPAINPASNAHRSLVVHASVVKRSKKSSLNGLPIVDPFSNVDASLPSMRLDPAARRTNRQSGAGTDNKDRCSPVLPSPAQHSQASIALTLQSGDSVAAPWIDPRFSLKAARSGAGSLTSQHQSLTSQHSVPSTAQHAGRPSQTSTNGGWDSLGGAAVNTVLPAASIAAAIAEGAPTDAADAAASEARAPESSIKQQARSMHTC